MRIGDKIYVGSTFYLSHGEDDFQGGITTISGFNEYGFVEVRERPNHFINPDHLKENQKKWKKEYGNQIARKVPDLRGEFNCPYDYSKENCPLGHQK